MLARSYGAQTAPYCFRPVAADESNGSVEMLEFSPEKESSRSFPRVVLAFQEEKKRKRGAG